MLRRLLTVFAATLALCSTAALQAHEVKAGDIVVLHPNAPPSLKGAPNGIGFVDLKNTGSQPDRLLKASAPGIGRIELHEMKMQGDVMQMRELEGVPIAPGATVKMGPGGLHMMLMQLAKPLATGDKLPLTLTFERAGSVTTELWVQPRDEGAKAMDAHHHKH